MRKLTKQQSKTFQLTIIFYRGKQQNLLLRENHKYKAQRNRVALESPICASVVWRSVGWQGFCHVCETCYNRRCHQRQSCFWLSDLSLRINASDTIWQQIWGWYCLFPRGSVVVLCHQSIEPIIRLCVETLLSEQLYRPQIPPVR